MVGSMVALLVLYFGLSTASATSNIDTLRRAIEQVFPSLQAADSNTFLSERLKESLYAAVGTHEADELNNSDAIADGIRQGFAKIIAADPQSAGRVTEMLALFEIYYRHARKLSERLATGQANLGDAATLASMAAMKANSESFSQNLKDFRSQRNRSFAASIDKAGAGAHEVVEIGYALLGAAFCVFVIILVALRRGIIAPIVTLSRISQEVSQGHFRQPPALPNRDEIGVLTHYFGRMISDIQANQETLEQIVVEGRRLSAESSSHLLTMAISDAFPRLARADLTCAVWFAETCFLGDNLDEGFYQVNAASEPEGHTIISAKQLESDTLGQVIWVRDPRSGTRLAAIHVATSDRAAFAKSLPILEALATNVANAIAAIRLAKAMHLLETRSQQMRTVFSSIAQGICILDDQMRIGPDYSLALERIIGRPWLSGTSLRQVWLDRTNIDADLANQISSTIAVSIGSDLLNFDMNSAVLPREVVRGQGRQRVVVELDWIPIVGSEGLVESIMLTLRDVTEVRGLKEAAEARSLETAMIEQLLQTTPQRFASFATLTGELLSNAVAAIGALGQLSAEQKRTLARDLHTLKGNSRSLGFTALASQMHEVETTYFLQHQQQVVNPAALATLRRQLGEAQEIFHKYQQLNDGKLGRGEIALGEQARRRFVDLVHAKAAAGAIGAADARQLVDALEIRTAVPVAELIAAAFAGIPAICQQLGQPVPRLEVATEGCSVAAEQAEIMIGVFTHMMRNSVDHGLKEQASPSIRIGIESAAAAEDAVFAQFSYRDSGRGLDLARLRDLGLKHGRLSPDAADQEVAELVFISGLSTADRVTDISGRGIGMDAIKSALQAAGGDVALRLETRHGEFHTFSLILTVVLDAVDTSRSPLAAA